MHTKADDYEKLFLFDDNKKSYPYQFGTREQDSNDSEAEAFHSNINQYENGKNL